ncbi:hypothetical protein Sjap_013569 [Stephania japonica]|uniref:Uncharacterized protein n=1 Tax=Stephania japonica TaxID=461633 RepID=A0AAP0NXS9_9MAGN
MEKTRKRAVVVGEEELLLFHQLGRASQIVPPSSNCLKRLRLPEIGLFKLNVDASVVKGCSYFTIGGVVRDQRGVMFGAFAKRVDGVLSLEAAEFDEIWRSPAKIPRGRRKSRVGGDSPSGPPRGQGWRPSRAGIPITPIANDTWDDALPEDLVRAAYDKACSTRYTALMHKLKKNQKNPIYVTMRHGGDTCKIGRARTSCARSGKRRRIGTPRSKAPGPDLEARWWFRVICDYPRKIGLCVSEVGVVGIVEASELGGGYGGFGASGLGAYRGVEDVEIDCKAHKVIVKGKQADPLKVLERVRRRAIDKWSFSLRSQSLQVPKKRRKQRKRSPNSKRRKKR